MLVLIVYWCKKADVSCAVQMEIWNGYVVSTSTQQSINLEISAREYWERTHFQDATRPRIPMHGGGKVSALRVLTRRT